MTMVETWGGASKICHLIRMEVSSEATEQEDRHPSSRALCLPGGKGPQIGERPRPSGNPLLALLLFSHLQVTPAAMWVLEKSTEH